MDGNVVRPAFGKKSEPEAERFRCVFVCPCGSTTFHLHYEGDLECAGCGAFDNEGEWRKRLPATKPSDEEIKDTSDCFRVTTLDSAASFVKRKLKAGFDNVVMVVLAHDDGHVSTYYEDAPTPDQRAWINRRLAEIGRAHV